MPAIPLIIALINALIGAAPTLYGVGKGLIDRLTASESITDELAKEVFDLCTAANNIARDRENAHLASHPAG